MDIWHPFSSQNFSAVFPNWQLAPQTIKAKPPVEYSIPGAGSNDYWHSVPVSCCTLIGCLHETGVPPWDDLATQLFADNMERARQRTVFQGPWLYRNEFALTSAPQRHFFLDTNGITPRANLFLNGGLLAPKEIQAGSYAGHLYDMTAMVNDTNALVIQVDPTDYSHDLAIGFIDWNPPPPDNGTGVWRNISIRQTGPFVLDSWTFEPRIVTDNLDVVNMTFTAHVRNLENRSKTFIGGFSTFIEWEGTSYSVHREGDPETLLPYASIITSLTVSNITGLPV